MDIKNVFKLKCDDNSDSGAICSTLKWLVLLPVIIGFLLRIVLLFNPQTQISFSFSEWIEIFALGFINDVATAFVCTAFIFLNLVTLNEWKYKKPVGLIILSLLGLTFLYFLLFHDITDDYGSVVPLIVNSWLAYKVVSFALRLFFPKIRQKWSYSLYVFFIFVTMFIMLLSAVGEYFFWDEFGVRYNFIAVDYLIYTNEVVGNIMESYSIVPIFSILTLVAGFLTWLIIKGKYKCFSSYSSFTVHCTQFAKYVGAFAISFIILYLAPLAEVHSNIFTNELQANGLDKLCRAFISNRLDYKDFYSMLPLAEAELTINSQYGSKGLYNQHLVSDSGTEIKKNIILITEESLSASYLTRYGNDQHLTPNLDKLLDESFVFDSLFAAGNRTVRGLEALTLCVPPTPGESVIKQKDNGNLFTVGSVLRSKGYITQFLYGGKAYFDNMAEFYSANGYEIIDENNFAPSQIHFSNIWGVCDEDIFSKAIEVMGNNAKSGRPAFLHIMTVSNHRPFTYPDHRIDIPPEQKRREGGVKYADYAIGKFMAEARKQPWFKNTVIVLVADHCSSSAGNTSIPLDKYQIPALIFSEGFIKPQKFGKVASQIDVMPTVLGMLHMGYTSYFYGQDVLKPNYRPRAFMATYEDMGYFEGNRLVTLSPNRKNNQFIITPQNHSFVAKKVQSDKNDIYLRAISNYQMASSYRFRFPGK
jgi:phosphoglycerol transferase MdoB-like AlkP superfamily enzyme